MALRRKEKRTEQSKLDATPPWETRRPHESLPTTGPYDVADIPAGNVERLDLGALRVPVETGLEIRVEVGEDGQVIGVTLLNPDGQMQLGVFAAPRKEGIWGEIRDEIKASISSQGGTVSERDGEFADKFNAMPKYVVSSTLADPEWNNTTVIGFGDVAALRDGEGGPIQVPGSISLVQGLHKAGLVDQWNLMVFPVILGSGRTLFPTDADDKQKLQLAEARTYSNGVQLQVFRAAAI